MSYDKISPEKFVSKLAKGDYKNAGAARRAVGRSSLSDAAKTLCYKAIEDHFKDPSAPAPSNPGRKKVAKKAPKKTPAKKKKVAKKKKATKKKAAKAPAKTRKRKASQPEKPMFNSTEEQLAKIHLAKERVGTIVQAINAMRAAKEVSPDLDTDAGAKSAQEALTSIVEGVRESVLNNPIDTTVAEKFAGSSAASVGIPGTTPSE